MMEIYAEDFVDRLDARTDHEALEVAAGTGALTRALASRVKSLLATDFAPKMIDVLRERMAAAGLDNISYEVMDGQALALSDASVDRAACCFGLMLFPDRAKGFSELRRVLRPSGRAIVSGWAGPDRFEGFGLFLGALKTAFPNMPAPSTPPPVFSLANLDSFKTQMEAGGFKDVQVEYIDRAVEVENFEALWEMFTAGAPPVQVLFDRLGPESPERARDALAKIVDDRFGSGPITMTNTATLGSGAVG